MKEMKKLLFFLLVFISVSVKGQVYQVMTQYGYETKRMNFDSTLQIPTVCGVPTLKSVVLPTKKAAIAFDSCNNRFYTYNPKTQTWSQVSGGADTTSLSNRINTKIDSIKRSTDSVFAKINGTWYYQFKDSVGTFTTPNLQQVTDAGPITTNTITIDDGFRITKLHENISNDYLPLHYYNELGGTSFRVFDSISQSSAGIDYTSDGLDYSYKFEVNSYDKYKLFLDYYDDYFQITNNKIELKSSNSVQTIIPLTNTTGYYDTTYFPNTDNIKDTLATLRDVRGVNVATGLGSVYDTAGVLLARVRNSEATTLNRGEVVYIYGSTGNVASVKRANNKQDSTSSKTFGVVKNNIAAGDTGVIVTQGQIDKLNLGSFSEGDILWLDSVDGQFTKTKPTAPYHQVFLGVVERANNGNGLAYIKVQNGYELNELHNVSTNGVANNDVLMYESSTQLWKNKPVNAVSSLNGLTANTQTFTTGTTGTDFNISSTTSTHTFNLPTANETNRGALSSADWNLFSNNWLLDAYQDLGSTFKSYPLTMPQGITGITSNTSLTATSARFIIVYIPVGATITGVKWYQTTQGNYTANNYNGVGLYTYSGGNLTLVASSTDDGNIWKAANNTWSSKAFSSTYVASSGIYVVALLYNAAAGAPQAPVIGAATATSNSAVGNNDFTNSAKISSSIANQNTLPSSTSMSSLTGNNTNPVIWLY